MHVRSGRLEKRIHLEVPVQISSLLDPADTEATVTENVCAHGVRVMVQRPRDYNEWVMLRSRMGDVQTPARVVYCLRVDGSHCALGLEFQDGSFEWPRGSMPGRIH